MANPLPLYQYGVTNILDGVGLYHPLNFFPAFSSKQIFLRRYPRRQGGTDQRHRGTYQRHGGWGYRHTMTPK